MDDINHNITILPLLRITMGGWTLALYIHSYTAILPLQYIWAMRVLMNVG